MKTCETCKWWEPDADRHPYMREKARPCCQDVSGAPAGIDVFADFSGIEIRTMPEFGCIHHTPKEEG